MNLKRRHCPLRNRPCGQSRNQLAGTALPSQSPHWRLSVRTEGRPKSAGRPSHFAEPLGTRKEVPIWGFLSHPPNLI